MKKKTKRISKPVVFYGRVESISRAKQYNRKIQGDFYVNGKLQDHRIATDRYEGIISEWTGGPAVTINCGETIIGAQRRTEERFKRILKKISARRNCVAKWEINDYEIKDKP